jgi:hypothetical protein
MILRREVNLKSDKELHLVNIKLIYEQLKVILKEMKDNLKELTLKNCTIIAF